jgi:uncharacterized protein with GYD domain
MAMSTYIVLANWTDQGVRHINETLKREDALRTLCEKFGGKVKDLYRTMGRHDFVVIIDAPDDAAVSAILLSLGSGGNSRTETLRAFTRAEAEQIIASIA